MDINLLFWKKLGITQKFNLVFSLLLLLLVLIAFTSSYSLYTIHSAEQKINHSKGIFNHVLEMDQAMERAHRLHRDFFIHYQHIGLQKAHKEYALPSTKEAAKVLQLSNELKNLLFTESPHLSISENHMADINLYLASAKRFANTSTEAVELVTERSDPEHGVEAQLINVCVSMQQSLQDHPALHRSINKACSHSKDYIIYRQRSVMQSALNELTDLRTALQQDKTLTSDNRELFLGDLEKYKQLSDRLLAIDLAITSKFNDFYLQEQTIQPISQTLISLARQMELRAEDQINKARRVAIFIITASISFSVVILLFISRLVHHSVTKVVLSLAETASAFKDGKLDKRITINSQDELGQLASVFNSMAAHLNDLIHNLEDKVAERTRELAESEERFRQLVRELPNIAVQGFDCNGIITYWNRASEQLFGYTGKEAIGQKIEKLIIQDDMQDEFREARKRWCSDNIPISAGELNLQHKSGNQVPVYAAYVIQTDNKNVKTLYSIDVNLAELKRAQTLMRKSESLYKQLFNHSSSGVTVFEPLNDGIDFVVRDINSAGEIIEGVLRNDILNRKASEVFPSLRQTGVLKLLREVMKTGTPAYRETSVIIEDQIESVRDNRVYQLPTGELVCVFDDITEQKKTMEANRLMEQSLQRAQKMEAIGLMAGGIAHDLNNTLSVIVGYPDLLLLQLDPQSPLKAPISAIKCAGERATAVVADLLTVAKGVATTKQVSNLNNLVQEFLNSPEFSELQTAHPEIEFTQYLAADLPKVLCSSIHIKKCLMHLVSNAAEAVDECHRITFSTRSTIPTSEQVIRHGLEPTSYAVLRISDDGERISEKDLERIFEPFYTKRTMGRVNGTGLGLSVVWNTMKDHDGAVIAQSSDKLTTFDLYFPAVEEELQTPAASGMEMPDNIFGNGETILVVDDEEQPRELARKILEHYGYKVHCHDSGEKAVEYLKRHEVDLVILDMIMSPGINGRQTYKEITRIHPNQRAIIASGFSWSEDIEATLRMGAGVFIKKPYTMKELAVSVKRELKRSK